MVKCIKLIKSHNSLNICTATAPLQVIKTHLFLLYWFSGLGKITTSFVYVCSVCVSVCEREKARKEKWRGGVLKKKLIWDLYWYVAFYKKT